MEKRFLVTTDGSGYADKAVKEALKQAKQEKADLYVLSVVDQQVLEEPGLSAAELVTIETEDKYHECMEEIKKKASDEGIDIECEIRHGVPHELILKYADEIDADVIFMGLHGDSGSHLGGVGERVVEKTDKDVEVVEP